MNSLFQYATFSQATTAKFVSLPVSELEDPFSQDRPPISLFEEVELDFSHDDYNELFASYCTNPPIGLTEEVELSFSQDNYQVDPSIGLTEEVELNFSQEDIIYDLPQHYEFWENPVESSEDQVVFSVEVSMSCEMEPL